MKNKKIILIIILFVIFNSNSVIRAQNVHPKISGSFEYTSDDIPDAIDIRTTLENIYWVDLTSHIADVKIKNHFSCILPQNIEPMLAEIALMKSGKYTRTIGLYYVEPNDDINIKIFRIRGNDSLIFAGKGCEKYNLIEAVKKQKKDFDSLKLSLKVPTNSNDLSLYLTKYSNLIIEFMNKKSDLINNYSGVNESIKKLISYQFGFYQSSWITTLLYFSLYDKNHTNDQSIKILSDALNLYKNKISYNLDPISVLSPSLFVGLATRIKAEMLINKENVDFESFYKKIKNSYNGIIKERLITEFFMSTFTSQYLTNYNPSIYDDTVIDAINSVNHPYYKQLIKEKSRTRKGTKVFDAEFMDLDGKPFKLESLRNKVVFIDMWAVGCTGCAIFHTIFKNEIYPFFKNNPNFQILSINGDLTKEKWIEGLKSGRYSSDEYLNVSTGSLGVKHPFFKYYTNALPLLLIIGKDGRIVTKVTVSQKTSDVVNLINSSLKNN